MSMLGSRARNAKRNIVSGIVRESLSILLAFATRTMVLYTLGEQYLGLNGLFTSILSVLNLAELGFNAAVIYFLYEPIANDDREKVCAITAYLRKIYHRIGVAIFVAGIVLIPFLPVLISGDHPQNINIYILYIVYLVNSAASYWFFSYKSVLFTAIQRVDIVGNIYSVISLLTKIGQLLVLIYYRNYYLFAIIMTVGTIVNNLVLELASRKVMPDIVPQGEISVELKKSMSKKMRAIFIGKLGDVARNGCDSIFLSAWFGLAVVAAYDNYLYIYTAIISVVWMLGNAIQAGVGNSIVTESIEKNRDDFVRFDFLLNWFVSWCTVCMYCLYQPFMKIWLNGRDNLMLSNVNMTLLCLYFYSVAICTITNVYASSAGLFSRMQNWHIVEALSNIILNAVLGYWLGVSGIILATLISVLACNFVARSTIVFRFYFRHTVELFFKTHFNYFIIMVCGCLATTGVCGLVKDDGISGFLLRIAICILVPNVVFVGFYWKDMKFHDCLNYISEVLNLRSNGQK